MSISLRHTSLPLYVLIEYVQSTQLLLANIIARAHFHTLLHLADQRNIQGTLVAN